MNTPILYSTFFLTLLMFIGLFFFIRASVKERTEKLTLMAEISEDSLLSQLKTYFAQRAYKVQSINAEDNQVTFQGMVQPSWFLAIFLSILAAVGLFCLSLVITYLSPAFSPWILVITFLSPGAGLFYWKKAGRLEKISLKLEPIPLSQIEEQTRITVIGHRDELSELQQALSLKLVS
ncbi:cofactor assembly of complex C subunit B [Aphanothece hegewaldii CCALA 016]|uniref:Cofactor assembly of complex C subunit B n=1 Tax=Aphanothece hegewaldii CCALA 016 TaxID=2107694 RepID=A0A2T1LS29_9CHRO|nr:cofactor assembly of complex C subunit B [Aphanothece hegewaldii]PSF32119.1 cofactor assembly of complex C subunit B [Aphanothece hegewaldii CCALA 016]